MSQIEDIVKKLRDVSKTLKMSKKKFRDVSNTDLV